MIIGGGGGGGKFHTWRPCTGTQLHHREAGIPFQDRTEPGAVVCQAGGLGTGSCRASRQHG